MKNCPKCNSEVEDNFKLCWNCNYSFTEKQIVEIEEFKTGVFGNIFELFVNRESFDLYICPKCGKVEFFTPFKEVEYQINS